MWGQPPSAVLRALPDFFLFEDWQTLFGTGKPRHELRPCRRSKIRQMRPTPKKDAAPWHKSGVKKTAVSEIDERENGTRLILFLQPIASDLTMRLGRSATRSFFAENFRPSVKSDGSGIARQLN